MSTEKYLIHHLYRPVKSVDDGMLSLPRKTEKPQKRTKTANWNADPKRWRQRLPCQLCARPLFRTSQHAEQDWRSRPAAFRPAKNRLCF